MTESPREYYRSAEVSRMRQMMQYRQEDFVRDWGAALALATLLADNHTDWRERLLDETMMRVEAFIEHNPYALQEMREGI
jgi:hypothetical protein